jgi:hypothetical protein
MLSGPSHQDSTLFFVRRFSRQNSICYSTSRRHWSWISTCSFRRFRWRRASFDLERRLFRWRNWGRPLPRPIAAARRKIENFSRDGGWQVLVRAEDRGISTAVAGHHNIIYAASNGLPFLSASQRRTACRSGRVQEWRHAPRAREQECLLFCERQPVMAATRSMIQHRVVLPSHFDSVLETQPT